MPIPATPVPTTMLDANSDQLPGTDTTNSAREQLLLAVQELNSIISQYGGAEMLTDANAAGLGVAFTNIQNLFTANQFIRKSAPFLLLENDGASDFATMLLRNAPVSNANAAALVNAGASNYAHFFKYLASGAGEASGLLFYNTGQVVLHNVVNASNFQIHAIGDCLVVPASGRKAYIGSVVAANEIATIGDIQVSGADFWMGSATIPQTSAGGTSVSSVQIAHGLGSNDIAFGLVGTSADGSRPHVIDITDANGLTQQYPMFADSGNPFNAGAGATASSGNLRITVTNNFVGDNLPQHTVKVWARRNI